jgi:ABC-type transporter Mla maintaining outer membrane lipid asymmetry ATPase subunit MlaF
MPSVADPVVLEFADVSYHDPRFATPLLEHLDFAIAPGQALAITGPAGSGKSTALAMALAALQPTRGEVLVSGRQLGHLDPAGVAHLRTRVGYVAQQGALLGNLSLLDNLALPVRYHHRAGEEETRRAVAAACEAVDLEPGDIPAVQPAVASHEMRQLVALAKALVLEPSLLLIDEPASGLGGNAGRQYWRLLEQIRARRGIAMLIATTDAPTAQATTTRTIALSLRQHDLSRLRPAVSASAPPEGR